MCDTLGRITSEGAALFAKNSDRSPNEPQVAEFRPARRHDEKALRATYIEIEQVPETHATLLSRPVWMWGAEMGANEHGVCIGNEAVFTKGKYAKSGLTGMDLVRLGLERGATARQALEVIIALLERYGQGGDCGYDHSFLYDNAFLIMDRREIHLLETAGKNWVTKKVESGSISNRLSIGAEGDAYSGGVACDFAGRYREPVYSHFSGSARRLAQTADCLVAQPDAAGMMAALRTHRDNPANPLARADVASPCMHAGSIVGDHTTASMVVELGEGITVWLTGSSTPCISLFKPWGFGNQATPPVFAAGHAAEAEAYWRRREAFYRRAVGRQLPAEFYTGRDALESEWLRTAQGAGAEGLAALSQQAAKQAEAFYQKWEQAPTGPLQGKRGYLRYWQKKTVALEVPDRPTVAGM